MLTEQRKALNKKAVINLVSVKQRPLLGFFCLSYYYPTFTERHLNAILMRNNQKSTNKIYMCSAIQRNYKLHFNKSLISFKLKANALVVGFWRYLTEKFIDFVLGKSSKKGCLQEKKEINLCRCIKIYARPAKFLDNSTKISVERKKTFCLLHKFKRSTVVCMHNSN
jgi:hypothetical protein